MEDVLLLTAGVLASDERVAAQVRRQYKWFVVDEFQDVSPLQSALLDLWLGGRDELCVVGDPAQTIYSFAGADATYLLDFPKRYEGTTSIELVRNYRSTPQVVAAANTLLAGSPSAGVELRSQQPAGSAGAVRRSPRRGRRGVLRRRPDRRPAAERHLAGADGRAVPDQRPVRALRGCAERPRHPLRRPRRRPLLRAAGGARGRRPAARLGRGRGRRPTCPGWRPCTACSAAWAGPPTPRPDAARCATGGSRGRRWSPRPRSSAAEHADADLSAFVERPRPTRRRAARAGGRRRHPRDLPRRQGAGVGRRVLRRRPGRHGADHLRRP